MKKLLFITLLSVSELAFAFTPSQDQALVDGRWDLLSINLEQFWFVYGDRNTHSNSFTWFLLEEFKVVNGKVVRRNGRPVAEKSRLYAATVNCLQRKVRVNSSKTYQGSFILRLERGRNPKLISSADNINLEVLPIPDTFGEAIYNYVCHEKTYFSQ
jgi:hypothetical protein